MAISNCLFLPTLEILTDFQFGVYLQSLVINHATTHSRDVSDNSGTEYGEN